MGELGLFGIPFPEQYGGSGGDTISYAIAVEEIGRACGGTGLSYAAAVSLGASPIYYFGTEEQKKEWLVPMAKGEAFGSFGLTEPNAGSDAGGTQTRAILEGDEYVINGEKCWITNAGYARQVIVTAVTGKDERGKILFLRSSFRRIRQGFRLIVIITRWAFVHPIRVSLFCKMYVCQKKIY